MMSSAVLAGLGGWVPPRVVTNDEMAEYLETSDEWIHSRTGIRQRHRADVGSATSDLAVEAGQRALSSAGLDTVDAVVVATLTPDRQLPHIAPEVAARLGLPGVAAFDVNAACSGFVYGLAVSAGLISAGTARSVLLIGADTFAATLDPSDRMTAVLFGDGAGAVVLRAGQPDEPGALGPFDLGSDGMLADLAVIQGGGSRERLAGKPPSPEDQYYAMRGKALFRQAVERMSQSAHAALGRVGWSVDQVDRLVGHQANLRILEQVGIELGLPADRLVSNIDMVANTVAASIPLAMTSAVASGELRAGQRVLLVAFGGGLSWGGTTLHWPDIKVVEKGSS